MKKIMKCDAEEITEELQRRFSFYYWDVPYEDTGVCYHGDQKVITIADKAMLKKREEYNYLVGEIEEVTHFPWKDWGYAQDSSGRYYYVNVEEER